ncbi:MAG: prepilin-type N-terminal cleavage/methylation domain-containing protein [Desulfobacterales bacterium]|uniref:Prepilin-type N-terminal cleavage/methylation domain-containing protein n=1 Tax=Candidatus Desulfatibia vada TaxID=2841696 RepID=A0A8J6TLC5_9BACT|nr:prepilin-type N-terminal cleavage/methylation domain-containing protein [Candidatus Desulfatibia vada]MBL6972715.1 prepilin-type N-terminal cleavage/methylation domain-containing protein [Desulfobacterales bacterium]MBL7217845.1 prepilin-type N-terminal cleavage/methylation domain-containing protein [Desulfobacteraceae bacterium]
MRNSAENKDRGFTLIELLIAMAIALIVITSLSSAFISQRKTYAVQEQITAMTQDARAAMDMISRELRMAGYDPTGAGIVGIPIFTATQLRIEADLNGDGDTLVGSNEIITYTEDSGNKQIDRATGSSGTPQPFAENIQSCAFQYDDADGNTATTAADIRRIKITITARTSKSDPDYGGHRTYKLSSYVTPPNLDL